MRTPRIAALALALLMNACAAPPLTLYTLGAPAVAVGAGGNPADAPTLEVRRVALPDYLDSQDIVTRNGQVIIRSSTGRWASRLSLGATDLIAARLAAARPDLFVTDQPVQGPVAWRLFVAISRLDVSAAGEGAITASWTLQPRDAGRAEIRDRTSVTLQGPTATDAEVAALTSRLLDAVAAAITADLARAPRSGASA
ncbi:PqiC family protein [Acidisoma sp. 7E03]